MNDRRWDSLDDGDEHFVDGALDAARHDAPDEARMRVIERRLEAVERNAAPSAWWRRSRAVAAVGLAILALGVVRMAAVPSRPGPSPSVSPPEPAETHSTPPSIPATASVAVEALPAAEPAAPESVTKVANTANTANAHEAKPRSPSAANTAPAPSGQPDELALLEEASQALEASPQKTLALTDEHMKRFRAPKFAQERERLAVVALVRLGRRADAKRRADAFEAAYPESAHLKRVRELVNP